MLLENCKGRTFEHITGWIHVRKPHANECIFPFCGERATRLGTQGSVWRHAWQNYRETGSEIIFRGRTLSQSAKLYKFVQPVTNFITENSEEQVGKVEKTKKIAKVPFSLPQSSPPSSEASTELEKRLHEKKSWDVEVDEKNDCKYKHRDKNRKHSSSPGTILITKLPCFSPLDTKSSLTRESGKKFTSQKSLNPNFLLYRL